MRYIYQTAFRDSELGKASAMAVFLFVIMGAFFPRSVHRRPGGGVMLNRSYYWLITAALDPGLPVADPDDLDGGSLSFQPNDVLARTTSTTAFGLIPIPFTADNLRGALRFRADAALVSQFGHRRAWHDTRGARRVDDGRLRAGAAGVSPETVDHGSLPRRADGAGTGGSSSRSTRCSPTLGGTTATTR